MRLLNTTTLTLHSFFDNDIPPYAILSHRWDEEEILFQDLQSGHSPSSSQAFSLFTILHFEVYEGHSPYFAPLGSYFPAVEKRRFPIANSL